MKSHQENGRGDRIRTRDPRFWRPMLYQLSYTPAGQIFYLHLRPWTGSVQFVQNRAMRIRFSALRLIPVATGFTLLSLTGCQPSGPIMGGKMPPAKYTTMVSLTPGSSELMNLLSIKPVGRGASDNYPKQLLQSLPVVANVKPDYEKIAAIHPGLIIYDASLFSKADTDKLASSGSRLFPIEGNTVADYEKCLYELASVALSETTMADYIRRIDRADASALGDPFTKKPKVVLLMASPNSNPLLASTGSFYADLIRQAGADPVGPEGTDFKPTSPEALLALNPDIVVVAGDYNVVKNDSRLSQIPAVKAGHIFGIDADLVLRRGGRVDIAITKLHSGMKAVAP